MSGALRWLGHRLRQHLADKLAITAALTLLFAIGWFLIPRHLVVAPRRLATTALERDWPLVEAWVAVYLSIGLFNVAAPYLTIDRARLHRHGRGFLAITLVAFGCFVLFPVETPPPTGHARTVLYGLLLADTRLNSFPSLHAGYTVYGLLYWRQVLPDIPLRLARWLAGAAALAWAIALILSVLFLKQHYLADLVAGGTLGAGVYGLAFRRPRPAAAAALAPLTRRREINP